MLPEGTEAPPAGFWLMTSPAGTVAWLAVVTMPTLRPVTAFIAASAVAWGLPTTSGTLTITGPNETTRSTVLPRMAMVRAVGFWLMTVPAANASLLAVVTLPTTKPALMI